MRAALARYHAKREAEARAKTSQRDTRGTKAAAREVDAAARRLNNRALAERQISENDINVLYKSVNSTTTTAEPCAAEVPQDPQAAIYMLFYWNVIDQSITPETKPLW